MIQIINPQSPLLPPSTRPPEPPEPPAPPKKPPVKPPKKKRKEPPPPTETPGGDGGDDGDGCAEGCGTLAFISISLYFIAYSVLSALFGSADLTMNEKTILIQQIEKNRNADGSVTIKFTPAQVEEIEEKLKNDLTAEELSQLMLRFMEENNKKGR
jgi:hypothetical protein